MVLKCEGLVRVLATGEGRGSTGTGICVAEDGAGLRARLGATAVAITYESEVESFSCVDVRGDNRTDGSMRELGRIE